MHTTLLLDITSGSVGAALAGLEEGALPKILFSFRQEFYASEKGMMQALRRTLDEAFNRGLPALRESRFPNFLDHVVITLSPPWAESRITSDHKRGAGIFESMPVGELFVTSSVDPDLLKRIENEVLKTLGVKRGASVQSFSYVFGKVFSGFSSTDKPVLLLRFAGEETELALLRARSMEAVGSINFGPQSITNHLSEKLDMPRELAGSMLSLFARGELDRDTAVRIDTLLASVEDKWLDMWEKHRSLAPREILFISEAGTSALAETLISSVFPKVAVGDAEKEGYFVPHLARGGNGDASLAVLAAFSGMIA